MSSATLLHRWLEEVTSHYDRYPYPHYPLLASVPLHDTYALNLTAVRGCICRLPPLAGGKILLAGSGAFAPYPFGLANPGTGIDAIDLSRSNLVRARLHTLLHGIRNVRFVQGDFMKSGLTGGYHLIDAFGVLHHLERPVDGFRRLASLLEPGGVMRVMVYGRYARQEAESIRRAMRLLRVSDALKARRILRKAPPGSRVSEYLDASWEARHLSGIADLFLHPCVTTYRMEEFVETVDAAGLVPLRFTHTGALVDSAEEIARFRDLDRRRESATNIVCYLGRAADEPLREVEATHALLNPSLRRAVSPLRIRQVTPMDRLGVKNPPIDRETARFLRRFRTSVRLSSLEPGDRARAEALASLWYLVTFTEGDA